MGIKPKKKCSHLLPFKLPIAQKIYSFISVSSRLVKMAEVIAPTKLPMAIPDKIKSKLSVLPLKVEILYIIADIIKAKAPENKGIAKIFVALKPKETAITAPKLAPLDIPIIPLSTIGFFKRLCIVQPHNAKAPPTITATIILGNLTKNTIGI